MEFDDLFKRNVKKDVRIYTNDAMCEWELIVTKDFQSVYVIYKPFIPFFKKLVSSYNKNDIEDLLNKNKRIVWDVAQEGFSAESISLDNKEKIFINKFGHTNVIEGKDSLFPKIEDDEYTTFEDFKNFNDHHLPMVYEYHTSNIDKDV